ncbi:MAG: hypothetical protein ACP5Q0_01815 [Halothiobacillus sp.]
MLNLHSARALLAVQDAVGVELGLYGSLKSAVEIVVLINRVD